VFFGESMFTRATDASKVCLVALVAQLQQRGGTLIDCQQETEHLASMGARPIPRDRFAHALGKLINCSRPPRGWRSGPIPTYA
jgi:leucyl/phenylalanyl-tRNA---protein transferase